MKSNLHSGSGKRWGFGLFAVLVLGSSLFLAWELRPIPGSPFNPFPSLQAIQKRVVAGDEHFRFAVMGDTRDEFANMKDAMTMAQRDGCDFFIHAGDIVERGGGLTKTHWYGLAAICGEIMQRMPLLPVLGNHEVSPSAFFGLRRYLRFFGLQRPYYTFDIGRYRFIVLSWQLVERLQTGTAEKCTEMRWFKDEVARSAGRKLIVCCHSPFYTIGSKIAPPLDVVALIRGAGVKLVLSGHDHIYYHTRRDGVDYVVSGAGTHLHMYQVRHAELAITGDAYLSLDPQSGQPTFRRVGSSNALPRPKLKFCGVEVQVDRDHIQVRAIDSQGFELDHFDIDAR